MNSRNYNATDARQRIGQAIQKAALDAVRNAPDMMTAYECTMHVAYGLFAGLMETIHDPNNPMTPDLRSLLSESARNQARQYHTWLGQIIASANPLVTLHVLFPDSHKLEHRDPRKPEPKP